ncbi:MAG: Arm DNA-binding domain-containing protein [Candidatus Aminicenantes bacterium]|nr:Arm DNA-binding domain-containing protein [Candidatus Aminicenantes bacterium]
MENNIKIMFWLNRTKKNSKDLVPVYLRVTQNYDHFIKATGIMIPASDCDKKTMRLKGTTPEVCTNNAFLDALKVKILQITNQLSVLGKPFNIHTIQKTHDGNETFTTVYKHYHQTEHFDTTLLSC